MKKLFFISFVLLSSCVDIQVKRQPHSCQLDQGSVDDNRILEKNWHQKTTLKGGLSGADVYKVVDSSGAVYVFRNISYRAHEDKLREIYAHKIASEYGYGPLLYAYNINKGKIVVSLLESSSKTLDKQSQISVLVAALKRMHRGPAFCDHISIIDQIRALYDKINDYPQSIEGNKIGKLITQILSLKNYPKKPTHRDLNPNNIFFTNRGVKFIDFENAAQDDPFFDIASIIIFYQYDGNDEKTFLKLYFGHELSQEEHEHLRMMKKAVSLFYGLTLLSKTSSSQKNIGAQVPKLKEILNNIASGELSLEKEENLALLAIAFLRNAINYY